MMQTAIEGARMIGNTNLVLMMTQESAALRRKGITPENWVSESVAYAAMVHVAQERMGAHRPALWVEMDAVERHSAVIDFLRSAA